MKMHLVQIKITCRCRELLSTHVEMPTPESALRAVGEIIAAFRENWNIGPDYQTSMRIEVQIKGIDTP